MAADGGNRRAVLEMYRTTRPRDVPAEMIEKATARRLAGDVAGAFAAARLDLDIDVAMIVRRHGRELADQVIDDLYHIAPDLLRWNLPRELASGALIGGGVLRRYGGAGGANLLVHPTLKQAGRLRLWVQAQHGPRDLPDRVPGWYHLPRAYWDVRYTGELRDLCGGGPDRIPFHDADGRLREVLPGGPCPDDPVAVTEWLTLLWDEGRTGEALAACGIALAEGQQDRWPKRPWVALERMVADARRVLDEGVFDPGGSRRPPRPDRTIWIDCLDEGQGGTDIELAFGPDGRVTARLRNPAAGDSRVLTAPEYRHPIDLDLLRFGLVRPDELHPAVSGALFPARPAGAGAATVSPGPASDAGGWELMERAIHRDTDGVRALLDTGADPLVRDRSGQTLLHLLPHLDHELLLPRLLAAGVHVNAVDVQGYTALHAAAAWRAQLGGSSARRPVEDLIGRLRNAGGVDVCGKRGVQCRAGAPGRRRPPSDEDVDRLRAAAARPAYASLAELAWALYATGKDRRQVLAECFGAPLPDEFFALADRLPLPGHRRDDLRCQAWRLALPPDRGGPVPPDDAGSDDFVDRVVAERDRRLVPVLRLADNHTEYGGLALAYDTTELAHGRSTVFGTDPLDRDGRIERLGPSLLAVLHDYHTTVAVRLEALHPTVDKLAGHREMLRLVGELLPPGAPGVTRPEPAAPFLTPVSGDTLSRLRGRASRGDYRSMARLAWALYAAGLRPEEVLAECLGVALPDEFFVLAEADPNETTPGTTTNLPWGLAVPLDRGGPLLRPSSLTWRYERRIFAWDPDLVPLLTLHGDERFDHAERAWRGVPHGHRLHCYRLSELAAGRTTVFGVPSDPHDRDLSVEPTGDSLLTILHEHAAARHALDEWELRAPWNRGAGSIDHEDVADARRIVLGIEALQRRVTDR